MAQSVPFFFTTGLLKLQVGRRHVWLGGLYMSSSNVQLNQVILRSRIRNLTGLRGYNVFTSTGLQIIRVGHPSGGFMTDDRDFVSHLQRSQIEIEIMFKLAAWWVRVQHRWFIIRYVWPVFLSVTVDVVISAYFLFLEPLTQVFGSLGNTDQVVILFYVKFPLGANIPSPNKHCPWSHRGRIM